MKLSRWTDEEDRREFQTINELHGVSSPEGF